MKKVFYGGLILLSFIGNRVFSQSGPPALPTLPAGRMLDAWHFQTTNWTSMFGDAPISFTNISLAADWAGNGLLLNSTNPAYLVYPVIESDGWTNIVFMNGSVEMWFAPDWNTSDGIGNWGTLLEAGAWNTNLATATGAWGLYISPDGSNLCFSAQNTNSTTNYLTAPIAWNAGEWHHIVITYSATNSALYLEGALVTNGPGMSVIPGASVLTNGFSVGSDGKTGMLQTRGTFNDLIAYNYPLDADTVSNRYSTISPNVYPLPTSGGFHLFTSFSAPPPPGGGDGSTNGGGGVIFNSPNYTTNDFWLEALSLGTNAYNTNGGNLTLMLHGTIAGISYQLLSTTNLQPTGTVWIVEQNLVGSGITNFTPATIRLGTGPQKFFKVLAYSFDSNDGGLPDWWQLKYFGHLGVDPFGDTAGDGWSNLQKYQMGIAPGTAITPPPPQNVVAARVPANTNAVLTWLAGGGSVDHYGIENDSGSEVATVSASTFTYTVAYPASLGSYSVRAYFTGGSHADSRQVSIIASTMDLTVTVIRGTAGQPYLTIPFLPPNLSQILLTWQDGLGSSHALSVSATNLTNGIMLFPFAQMQSNGFVYGPFYCKLFDTNGNFNESVSVNLYFPEESNALLVNNFVDSRRHMKENLKFLLRSATVSQPFSYTSNLGTDGSTNHTPDYSYTDEPYYYFARPPSPTNYEYYGFHFYNAVFDFSAFDIMRPIKENYLWRNIAYNPDDYNTGADCYYNVVPGRQILRLTQPEHQYTGDGSESPLPVALTTANSAWILLRQSQISSFDAINFFGTDEVGIYPSGSDAMLGSDVRNCYGLTLNSMQMDTNQLVSAGQVVPSFDGTDFFLNFDAPLLQTVDYYFASESGAIPAFGDARPRPPMPGTPDFSVTNVSPVLVTGIGQPITVAGWAKEAITNGYTGKYAYLEQYFDKAYKMNTDGSITTNQTGLLSPYGEFFPTEPGPAALVTLPDIDTGQRGTGVVNVIKLQLDANHDGVMDLSFSGADNTSADRPFKFWANNDYDRYVLDSDGVNSYDDGVQIADCPFTPNHATLDCNFRDGAGNRVIPCVRDLQDFTRLWVSGITSNMLAVLPTNNTITLSWGDVGNPNSSNPTIDLFKAADADGGMGYLTNSAVADVQVDSLFCPYIGRLSPGQSIQLNASQFSNHWSGNYLIWCGVTNGSGVLTLTISDSNSNTLAQTRAYIQIMDIKEMYERWTLGDEPNIAPKTNAVSAEDGLPPFTTSFLYAYNPTTDASVPYILYVHGWNMKRWEKDRFAETAYKRLYWQGYQGQFGVFRWPTDNGFTGTLWSALTDGHNYDGSELTAWKSATGLLNKLNDLNAKYPGHVYMLAHSMGNVVAGEALRLAGNNQIVNTYIASQGAIPAHVYDSTSTNLIDYTHKPSSYPFSMTGHPITPNIYGNRLAGNSAAVGRRINFYNFNDFALSPDAWCFDQALKPDTFVGGYYYYNGSTNDASPWNHFEFVFTAGDPPPSPSDLDIVNDLEQRYETFAYASQPYSKPLGSTPGITTLSGTLNLQTVWPADTSGHSYGDHFWHSAEFRGDSWQEWNYWHTLLFSTSAGFNIGD